MIDAKDLKQIADMYHREYVEWGDDAEILREIMLRLLHFAAIGHYETLYRKEVPQPVVACLKALGLEVVENGEGAVRISWSSEMAMQKI